MADNLKHLRELVKKMKNYQVKDFDRIVEESKRRIEELKTLAERST